MNLTQAAAWLGVTAKELRVAAERGHVDAIHPLDDGPWLFNRSVLEAEAAQRLIERVRERRTPRRTSNSTSGSIRINDIERWAV
jgi:hypothetical protein